MDTYICINLIIVAVLLVIIFLLIVMLARIQEKFERCVSGIKSVETDLKWMEDRVRKMDRLEDRVRTVEDHVGCLHNKLNKKEKKEKAK